MEKERCCINKGHNFKNLNCINCCKLNIFFFLFFLFFLLIRTMCIEMLLVFQRVESIHETQAELKFFTNEYCHSFQSGLCWNYRQKYCYHSRSNKETLVNNKSLKTITNSILNL